MYKRACVQTVYNIALISWTQTNSQLCNTFNKYYIMYSHARGLFSVKNGHSYPLTLTLFPATLSWETYLNRQGKLNWFVFVRKFLSLLYTCIVHTFNNYFTWPGTYDTVITTYYYVVIVHDSLHLVLPQSHSAALSRLDAQVFGWWGHQSLL